MVESEEHVDDAPARSRRTRRPSRWDRPKPPKDWRYFVGGLGRVLISTGVLLFLFVGYQLWGTGIEEAQSQGRLENEFESLIADLATTTTSTTLPPGTTTPEPGVPEPGVPEPGVPEPGVPEPDSPEPDVPGLVEQVLPPIEPGDALGIIEMPTIGVKKFVVAGVAVEDLRRGPGHFSNTPLPGQLGNSGIAGHRTTYGAPFLRVDELDIGDPIIVTTPFGTYTYRVTGQTIVGAADGWVLNTVDPTKASITLVSCHPRYTARQRLIISADLDVAASSPVGMPLIQYVSDPPPTIEPVLPDEELPGEELPGDEPAGSTDDTPPTEATEPSNAEPAPDELQDELDEAFGRGWFSDPDAWPQVALWGVVLILLSIGATLVSRWARRNWVGALVGIVPFTVALYFWFQNVNRLLPPSL